MDYLNQKELRCGLDFMTVQEHTRNEKKFLAQNKWEGNMSSAPLFPSKVRAGGRVVLASGLSTLLTLGRESMVGLSDGSPSVDTEHSFSWSSCAHTPRCTDILSKL